MPAVMPKLISEIATVFSKSAMPSETKNTGIIMLNLTERNTEKTSIELYIHRLGTRALNKKTVTDGYRKNRPGRKT